MGVCGIGAGATGVCGRAGGFDHHPVVLLGEEAKETADADLLGAVDLGAGS
jgi:hypothetical protein